MARRFIRRVPLQHDVSGEVTRGAERALERPRDEIPRGVHERGHDERVQVRLLLLCKRHRDERGDILGGERAASERHRRKRQRERRFRERALERFELRE